MDYKFSAKAAWRRRAWKMLADRVKSPGRCTVLYLAGEQDLDRAVALRNGFRRASLIAVEEDRDKAASLREMGVTTVVGSLAQVMEAWPPDWPVHAVNADFMSGIEQPVLDTVAAWARNPAFSSSSLLVNLLRGRDKIKAMDLQAWHRAVSEGDLRQLKLLAPPGWEDRELLRWAKVFDAAGVGERSRVRPVVMVAAMIRLMYFFDTVGQASRRRPDLSVFDLWMNFEKHTWRLDWAPVGCYRSSSGRVWFDSVLLAHNIAAGVGAAEAFVGREIDRQLAAIRAITTRRMRGELGGGRRA